ncbi:MAG: hypothetical protein M3Q58_06050 [Bacteroidota bacterium]|nr:hypothetical protein [Bacteroidota bacterium]
MNFVTRLFKFLIGFLIGSTLVYFLLIKDRDRNLRGWLPSERVSQEILEQELKISSKAICQLQCLKIPQESLKNIIEEAKVNFSESQVRKEPCPIYLFQTDIKEGKTNLEIQKCKDYSTLLNIQVEDMQCDCF